MIIDRAVTISILYLTVICMEDCTRRFFAFVCPLFVFTNFSNEVGPSVVNFGVFRVTGVTGLS